MISPESYSPLDEYSHVDFPPDPREPWEAELELKIQNRAAKKDPEFRPSGTWKEFVREEHGVKVYKVDSEWIRNNLLARWNHGGHGYVCEFIPADEVWVGTTHPADCDCQGVNEAREISDRYFESTVLHEVTELNLMKDGMIYWHAHHLSLEKEKEANLLPDGYSENYKPLPADYKP